MRFFIALEIPLQNQIEIEKIQQQLKNSIPQVRITNTNKLHLTIAFIGEQPESTKEKLIEIINQAIMGIASFTVTPAYIDAFPNLHHPHTFWVGVKGDIDKLLLLRERVKDRLEEINLEADERRFIPHIAIGKIKDYRITHNKEEELVKIMQTHYNPINIYSVKLFESIPDGSFHTHNTLAEIKLSS